MVTDPVRHVFKDLLKCRLKEFPLKELINREKSKRNQLSGEIILIDKAVPIEKKGEPGQRHV
jgi:hypothetical protein